MGGKGDGREVPGRRGKAGEGGDWQRPATLWMPVSRVMPQALGVAPNTSPFPTAGRLPL